MKRVPLIRYRYRYHTIAQSTGREFDFPLCFCFSLFHSLLGPVASPPAFKRPADHPQSLFCYAQSLAGRSLPAHFLAAFTSSFLHSFVPRFIPGIPTDTILHFIAINIFPPRFRFLFFYFLFTFLREELLFPLSFLPSLPFRPSPLTVLDTRCAPLLPLPPLPLPCRH